MALNFPSGPVDGQTYTTQGGTIYTYNASIGAWQATGSGYIANTTTQSFVADGATSTFFLNYPVNNQNNLLVTLDGLLQTSVVHYTTNSTALTFTAPPPATSFIEVKNYEGVVNYGAPVVNYVFSPFLLMGV
jgi:hypothetical protein